ncbi:hypothetical protein ACFL4W_02280 [Planctomycetota bacterium]
MPLGSNRGFGHQGDNIVVMLIIIILAVIAVPNFIKYRNKARLQKACVLLEEQTKALDLDLNKTGKPGQLPEGVCAPSLELNDDKLKIVMNKVAVPAAPGEKMKVSGKLDAAFAEGGVELVEHKYALVKYFVSPLILLICFLVALKITVGLIVRKEKKAPWGALVGLVIAFVLGYFILAGLLERDKITVTAAGFQESEAVFSKEFTSEGKPEKVEGFALFDNTKHLVCFHYDEKGQPAGRVIAAGDREDLLKIIAALNAVIPETDLKRVFCRGDR